jgi:Fe2+ or Zn2+ uptake regulation protein
MRLTGDLHGLQKQSNLRMTRQRKVILEELRKVSTHPSADEVYEMVRRRLPRISLGTVYRNLEILSESGDIQKLEPGCSLKRFDGNPYKHYHIRCTRCDRVVDAPADLDLKIDHEQVKTIGFKIMGYMLEFLGLCSHCSENPKSAENQESPDGL